uniref:Uncharacterized protein n=1 Tax=Toxocara canis TaxID=6265 RepID=A0A183VBR7_TOXCA
LTTKPFLSEISFPTLWKPCWEEWFDRESTAPSSSVVSDGSCSNVCRLVALDSVAQQRCELNSALVAAGPVRWNKWTNIRDLSSQQMKNLWKTQATAGANSESFHRRRPHNEPMQQVNGSYGTRWNASSSAHYADLCDPRGDINSNSNLLSRRDEALDRLQMNFPALSRVKLEEYMEELMARGHHRSLYNTPVAQIVSGVAHLISSEYE